MDETTKELNREIKAMVAEMQDPEKQEEKILNKDIKKNIENVKIRAGL